VSPIAVQAFEEHHAPCEASPAEAQQKAPWPQLGVQLELATKSEREMLTTRPPWEQYAYAIEASPMHPELLYSVGSPGCASSSYL